MRDDDYNRLMSREASSKHFAIVFLITILMCLLLVWSVASAEELPHVDEACAFSFGCQDDLTYDLMYQGDVISEPNEDLTKEECEALAQELQPQTDPFTEVTCRPRLVEREGA